MLGSLVLGLALSGCVSSGGFYTQGQVGDPWKMPSDAYPTQRLYRVKYKGPEGEVGFKLALYLEHESRYRMLATDLGRRLWSLSVNGQGEAVWVDYRGKEYCRAGAAGELGFVPLANLPLISMPKLLLGLLPAEPVANLKRDAERIAFLDARGQLWNAGLNGDQLDWWSLVEFSEAVVWWRREERGGIFVDLDGRQQVRWSEIVREALQGPLAELVVPKRFRQVVCGEATAS